MKCILYIGFIFLIVSCKTNGQKMAYGHNTKLQLTILDKEVILKPGVEFFDLNVSIKNNSDSSFILYDFKNIYPGGSDPNGDMQPFSVGGNNVFTFKGRDWLNITDSNSSQHEEFIRLLKSKNLREVDSAELLSNSLRNSGERMRDNMLVLKHGETWVGKFPVKVRKVRLLKQKFFDEIEEVKVSGESELYLIFNCGVNITNLIPLEKIKEDERVNDAVLFQGYVRSNSIKLIIKPNADVE